MQEINVKYNLKSLLENYRVVIPLIQPYLTQTLDHSI